MQRETKSVPSSSARGSNDYSDLNLVEQAALAAWIDYAIEPSGEIGVDSYLLRQDFQVMAFSVTNEAIREAVRQAGYEPEDPEAICWHSRAWKRLPRRGSSWYALTAEDKPRWCAFQKALREARLSPSSTDCGR